MFVSNNKKPGNGTNIQNWLRQCLQSIPLKSRLSGGESSVHANVAAQRKSSIGKINFNQLIDEECDFKKISRMGRLYFSQGLYVDAEALLKHCPEWDLVAQYLLAIIYFDGLGIEANEELGVKHMLIVANALTETNKIHEKLIRSAQYCLGRALYEGAGVGLRNEEEAIQWWLKAANKGRGSIEAQTALGLYYCDLLHKDLPQANRWYYRASVKGSLRAKATYAVMRHHGLGTDIDFAGALKDLMESSKNASDFYASGNLVEIYYQRKLFRLAVQDAHTMLSAHKNRSLKDPDHVFTNASMKGLALASFYLGRCYHLGNGIKKNIEAAKLCYKKAAEFDYEVIYPLYQEMILGVI